MKEIYDIQKIVEVDGDAWANAIAQQLNNIVGGQLQLGPVREKLPEVSDADWEIIEAALKWKITEKLAEMLTATAEGWCEVYYRDLKRRYKGE